MVKSHTGMGKHTFNHDSLRITYFVLARRPFAIFVLSTISLTKDNMLLVLSLLVSHYQRTLLV